jgi:hypothetical protein
MTPFHTIEIEFLRVLSEISFPKGIHFRFEQGILVGEIEKFPILPGLESIKRGVTVTLDNGNVIGSKDTTFFIDNFLFNLSRESSLKDFAEHLHICLLNLAMSIQYITNVKWLKIDDEIADFQVNPQGEQVFVSLSTKSGKNQYLSYVTYKVVKN